MNEYVDIDDLEENDHIIKNWQPLEFNIDENYEYIKKEKVFSIFSNIIYYVIAFPILKVVTKIMYDLKIEGKENIENLEKGAISVSNHVLILDCAMIGLAFSKRKIYYSTLEDNFKIPLVRKLIKFLRAVPIPKKINNMKNFLKAINEVLENNQIMHFYPETSLFPYCERLRSFKNGAFDIAIKNDVPIVPLVFTFREPKGLRKIFKNKKDVTLTVLKPVKNVYSEESAKEKAIKLKEEVHNQMEATMKEKYQ